MPSGDQMGSQPKSKSSRRGRAPEPSGSMSQHSHGPRRRVWKAMSFPSGDQWGNSSISRSFVMRACSLPSARATNRFQRASMVT